MGRLICPNCGSEVRLPERSSIVTGMTFSRESNGTHYLDMETNNNNNTNNTVEGECTMKALERIEALKNAGIDTTDLFALNNTLYRNFNGELKEVKDEEFADIDFGTVDNNIMESIDNSGYIFDPRLDGRWILAQMIRMMGNGYYDNYNQSLNAKGYMYQWDFLVKSKARGKLTGELIRISKMQEQNDKYFDIKSKIWSKEVIIAMLNDYCNKLKYYIDSLTVKYYKKKEVGFDLPYVRLGNRYTRLTGNNHGDILLCDVNKKLISPVIKLSYQIRSARTYKEIAKLVYRFKKTLMVELPYSILAGTDFKSAYKINGVYFSAMNMIKFHNCRISGLNTELSLNKLDKLVNGWIRDNEQFKSYGWFKEFVKENNFTANW